MVVRLTKKLAEVVNDLDLSHCAEGDAIDLPEGHAEMLLTEGWAVHVPAGTTPTQAPVWRPISPQLVADRPVQRRSSRETDYDELVTRLGMGVRVCRAADET
jgi:hypothetical protein